MSYKIELTHNFKKEAKKLIKNMLHSLEKLYNPIQKQKSSAHSIF